ncbi:MAG: GAF domain-containing protein [Candidatus Zixiibacteriota bacterium]
MKDNSDEKVTRFWTKIGLMAEVTSIFRNVRPDRETYINALKMIQQVVPFDSAGLYLLYANRRDVVNVVNWGEPFEQSELDEIQPDFLNWIRQQTEPVRLTRQLKENENNSGDQTRTLLTVPLLVEDQMIGVVAYLYNNCSTVRDKDIKLLSIIGDQMALSIERMIHLKKLENSNIALKEAHNQLREMQSELIKDERLMAVKQLAVSINHEINNPLSVITGNVEYLLYLNKSLDEKAIARLKVVYTESLRIAEINRKLLEIQTLVSEKYLNDSSEIEMINLEKSTAGE